MKRFLLFVALSLVRVGAQQPAPAGALTGRVVDATTKEGVRKATVYANQESSGRTQAGGMQFLPPTIYSAVTDDSGAYRFPGLPPAGYYLRAEKAGYIARPSARQTRAAVAAGESKAAGDLVLARQGVLMGTVTDGDGEPMDRVRVVAIPARRGSGRSGIQNQTMTDDRGQFRIPRLNAGRYKVVAVEQNPGIATPVTATGERSQVAAPTYYPGALDFESAGTVTVGSGEERTGVDIRLQKTPAVRVAGRVTGEMDGRSPVPLSLMQVGASTPWLPQGFGGALTSLNTMAGPGGTFEFPSVTPGEYVLQAHANGGANGSMKLRVGGTDVEEVTLEIHPLAKVTGRVVAEGNAKLPLGQVNVGMRSSEAGMPGGGGSGVRPDGTFALENIPRARMRLTPMAPKGWYLKALQVGGQRQPGLEFDVTGAETAIELIYSNRPGAVDVTVEGLTEESGPVVVAALPDGGNGLPPLTNLYKSAAVAEGRNVVKIEDVAPGNYYVLACAAMYLDAVGDPAVWEKVKSKAVAVKVGEGETNRAAPRLIVETDVEEN